MNSLHNAVLKVRDWLRAPQEQLNEVGVATSQAKPLSTSAADSKSVFSCSCGQTLDEADVRKLKKLNWTPSRVDPYVPANALPSSIIEHLKEHENNKAEIDGYRYKLSSRYGKSNVFRRKVKRNAGKQ